MPSRFSSQYDHSQTFQFLVEQNERQLEAQTRALDAEREAEWAARDSLVFTKWQEGKLSGNELMAHINKRMRQTGYDKAQQLQWKEAAVQYGNVIADEKAEAAFAENDDLNALISHYTKRLAGTKAGTPERREIAERLKGLREKRETDQVRTQARRIQRQIDRGKMSTKDMIDFYKSKLGEVTNRDLRQDIKDNIAKLQGKLREERFDVAMNDIDTQLASGHMSPQAAADAKVKLIDKFGIRDQNPVAFSEWQTHIQQLRATPDPAEVEKLELALIAGNITPEEYSARIRQFADQIAPFDLTGSWELKQEAQNFINDYATPLEEDSLLGKASAGRQRSDGTYSGPIEVVRKLRGNAIKHITQFDGGKYNSTNCGMAAGAMVAHMMGYTGLTGSDLRSLSGDTAGGTNAWQAMGALTSKQVGIPSDSLDTRSNWSFDEFKQRVANGAPAVLSGWTGDLPPQLNSTSGIMGHGVAIAGYDAKRDAFLVLDPSGRGNQAKAWWPAEVVRSFAWGGQGGFNGIAMIGPANTIDPKTLSRVGGKIKHIDVTAPPERFPDAPPIQNAMEPGPQVQAQVANDSLTKLQKQRLRDAGINPGKDLDTKQEVNALLAERQTDIESLRQVVDEWVELSGVPGAFDEETGSVTLVTTGQVISANEIADIQKRLLFALDGQQILHRANGQPAEAAAAQRAKNEIMVEASVVNTIEASYAVGRIAREMRSNFTDISGAQTPEERRVLANDIMDSLGDIAAIFDAEQPEEEPEEQTDAQSKAARVDTVMAPNEWGTLTDLLGEAADAETSEEAAQVLMGGLGELELFTENEELISQIATLTIEQKAIETEEARYVAAGGRLHVVTYDEFEAVDPNTGETYPQYVMDVSNLPEDVQQSMADNNISVKDLAPLLLPDPSGAVEVEIIPEYAEYGGLKFLIGTNDGLSRTRLEDIDIPDDVIDAIEERRALSADAVASLSPAQKEILIAQGSLRESPFYAQRAQWGGRTWWKNEGVAGQDPVWSEGRLQFAFSNIGDADDPILNDGGYVGQKEDAARSWPALDVEENETDTGTLLLAAEGVPDNVRDEKAREMLEEGRFPSVVNVPDPTNPDVLIEMPAENVLVSEFIRPLFRVAEEVFSAQKARDDAMVTTLSEDEAAEYNAWSDAEKQDYADSMGWNLETKSFGPIQTGEQEAVNKLKALGIKGTPETAAEEPVRYDPQKVATEQALGVKKANKLERDAKRKAALAERDLAAKSALRAPDKLPKLAPKLPEPRDTSGYGPRVDSSITGKAKSYLSGLQPPKPKPFSPDDPSTYTSPTQITRGF
jgi:hypothetical protein